MSGGVTCAANLVRVLRLGVLSPPPPTLLLLLLSPVTASVALRLSPGLQLWKLCSSCRLAAHRSHSLIDLICVGYPIKEPGGKAGGVGGITSSVCVPLLYTIITKGVLRLHSWEERQGSSGVYASLIPQASRRPAVGPTDVGVPAAMRMAGCGANLLMIYSGG